MVVRWGSNVGVGWADAEEAARSRKRLGYAERFECEAKKQAKNLLIRNRTRAHASVTYICITSGAFWEVCR